MRLFIVPEIRWNHTATHDRVRGKSNSLTNSEHYSEHFVLESADLLADFRRDFVFGEIDGWKLESEKLGHFARRHLFDDVEMEYLKLLRIGVLFDLVESGLQEVLFPFLIPNGFKVEPGQVLLAFQQIG